MEELIRKSDARRAILKASPASAYCIEHIRAVDVVEVVHGRWVLREDGYHCSNCDIQAIYTGVKLNYCPNCGAKMDLKGE